MPQAIDRAALDELFDALERRGYTLVGPTVRDRAIVLDELDSTADLPAGWTDVQEGGTYRLARRDDDALFGHNVGPNSWKSFLFPSELRLWTARRAADGGAARSPRSHPSPALRVHRRALLRPARDRGPGPRVHGGRLRRPATTGARREGAFIVAVNCGQAAAHLLLRLDGHRAEGDRRLRPRAHRGARGRRPPLRGRGRQRARRRGARRAGRGREADGRRAGGRRARDRERRRRCRRRAIDTDGIKELLYRNRENPRWDDVADRCLTCGNCTMVCPTCFCHTVEDVTDLAGEEAERTRLWDSCFTLDHSYIHGGSVHALDEGALPPVDDAQARDLDRPVRHLGLRRLRALHRLVPGGDRHHRGGGRDPEAERCRRSMSCSRRSTSSAGSATSTST